MAVWKIFNIGKANQEIERLEAELAAAKATPTAASTATPIEAKKTEACPSCDGSGDCPECKGSGEKGGAQANSRHSKISAELEASKAQHAKAMTDLSAVTETVSRLTAENERMAKEIVDINAKLAAKDAEVAAKVSRGLQESQAAIGAPQKPTPPAEGAAKPKQEAKGMDRIRSSALRDLEAAGYQRKN